MSTALIITTRNEFDTIGAIVAAAKARGYRVFVVDDDSTDGTCQVARDNGADVVHCNARRIGIGPSLKWGLLLAYSRGVERAVVMDAGGSHSIADVDRVENGGADVVIGSRFIKGAKYIGRPWRALLSRAAAAAFNFIQPGAAWSDWSSGFRSYSRPAMAAIVAGKYAYTMHAWQLEVLARLGALGFTVAEVPITYVAGRSSMSWAAAYEVSRAFLDVLFHGSPVPRRRRRK